MVTDKLALSSVLGIHHLGLAVRDLKQAVEFYAKTTMLSVLEDERIFSHVPHEPDQCAVLKGPNGHLQLMQFSDAPPSGMGVIGPGATHICFQAPASRSLYKTFVGQGAVPVSVGNPPIDLNGAGVRYAYARDQDNIMFEVEELDQPRFEGPIWIAHIALACEDIDRSVEFYRELLGVEPYGRANKVMGPRFDEVTGIENVRIRAAWFNTGNMVIELWQFINPPTPKATQAPNFCEAGHNKIALEVEDLAFELDRLAATGVALTHPPFESRGITEAYLRDPDGNLLSLVEVHGVSVSIANMPRIDWLPSPRDRKASA
ncbi:MAG: VOC family protein [Pseudomonadales bacterium]